MAYEISAYSLKITLVAGADLSGSQYLAVKLNASGQAVPITAATDVPIGILQNQPKSGQEAEIVVSGGSKIKASAAISLPAQLTVSATGAAAAAVAGTDITKYVFGQPLVAAGGPNEVITAVVNFAAPNRAA